MMKTLLLAVSVIFIAALTANAACTGSSPTWTSTPDQTSVAGCITNAQTGDTINVSNGTATWSALTVSKAITLKGGNGGTTTINGSGGNVITINPVSGKSTRLTGFTFVSNPTGVDNTDTVIVNTGPGLAPFRIDNNTFTMTNNGTTMGLYGLGPGLVDHNTLTGGGAAEIIHILGAGSTSSTAGWTDDIIPGSYTVIYLEDNTVTGTDPTIISKISESYYGAREVIRYNHLHFVSVDAHGNSTNPSLVGTRWYEIYNNDFNDDGKAQCCSVSLRGGSGLVYNNTATGSSGFAFQIEEDATCSNPDSNPYHVGSGILGGPTGANYSTPLYAWNNTNMGLDVQSCFTLGNQVKSSSSQPTLTKCESAADVNAGCSSTGVAQAYTYTPLVHPYPLDANGMPSPTSTTSAAKPVPPTNLLVSVQ